MSETDVGLSDLPDGWVWTALEEVIQIIDYRGRTPPYSSGRYSSFTVIQYKKWQDHLERPEICDRRNIR